MAPEPGEIPQRRERNKEASRRLWNRVERAMLVRVLAVGEGLVVLGGTECTLGTETTLWVVFSGRIEQSSMRASGHPGIHCPQLLREKF